MITLVVMSNLEIYNKYDMFKALFICLVLDSLYVVPFILDWNDSF